MSTIGDLVVKIGADGKNLSKGLAGAKSDIASFVSSASGILAPLTGALALDTIIDSARDARKSGATLDAVLNATGHAAGLTSKELKTYAAELQRVTNFSGDATIKATAFLATFKNLQGDDLKRAIALTQDLATLMDRDLDAAARKLGKTFKDMPVDEVGSKLSQLEGEFGGLRLITDPITQLTNSISNLGQTIAGDMLPGIDAIAKGVQFASDTTQQFKTRIDELTAGIGGLGRFGKLFGPTAVGMAPLHFAAGVGELLGLKTPGAAPPIDIESIGGDTAGIDKETKKVDHFARIMRSLRLELKDLDSGGHSLSAAVERIIGDHDFTAEQFKQIENAMRTIMDLRDQMGADGKKKKGTINTDSMFAPDTGPLASGAAAAGSSAAASIIAQAANKGSDKTVKAIEKGNEEAKETNTLLSDIHDSLKNPQFDVVSL